MSTTAIRTVPEGFMTIKDAAVALGVVPMTINRMFRRGQLSKYKEPRNNYYVLIRTEDVEKLLAGPQLAD